MLWDDYKFLCSEWARSNHCCWLSLSVCSIKTFPFAVQPGCTGMQVPAKFGGGTSLRSLENTFLGWNPALWSDMSPLDPFISTDKGTVLVGEQEWRAPRPMPRPHLFHKLSCILAYLKTGQIWHHSVDQTISSLAGCGLLFRNCCCKFIYEPVESWGIAWRAWFFSLDSPNLHVLAKII